MGLIFCELHIVVQRSHFTSDGIIHLNYMVSNVIHSIGKCLTISDVVFFTINFELGEGFVKVQHHLTKLVLLTKFVKFKIVELNIKFKLCCVHFMHESALKLWQYQEVDVKQHYWVSWTITISYFPLLWFGLSILAKHKVKLEC